MQLKLCVETTFISPSKTLTVAGFAENAAMRAAEILSTWSMLEVYLLAALVAIVKLSMMATVDLKVGAYAFFVLILVSTAANSALEPEAVWSRLEKQT